MKKKFKSKWKAELKKAEWNGDYSFTKSQRKQIVKYIHIFISHDLSEHWEVNQIIEDSDRWDEFDEIRSINTHVSHRRGRRRKVEVYGIMPHVYKAVCDVLQVSGSGSSQLVDYERW